MTDATKEIQKEISSLKDNIANITKQIGESTKTKFDQVREGSKDFKDNLEQNAYKLGEKTKNTIHEAEEMGKRAAHYVEVQAKEHPVAIVSLAFFIGMIIGKIGSSGRRD